MNKKELAKALDGCQCGRIPEKLILEARNNYLVIVYGASDDLMEFEGAFTDECGCFDGGTVWLDMSGVSQDGEYKDNEILARWCEGTDKDGNLAAWSYETDIPHETFKMWEDNELYCIGLVFALEDLK